MSGVPANVAALDSARFFGMPLLVCVCTFAVMILDGFDIQVIGFAAPALVAEFGIERSALAPALAASVIGMSLGALIAGPVGDRWGRRPALLGSTALFGAMTLMSILATDVASLAAWRFFTGVGLGGALPGAVALMAEFAPARLKSQLIVASLLGIAIGGILGSALAAELVPEFGWRAIFVAGGLLPLGAAALLFFVLPESPRFLAMRGDPPKDRGLAAVFAPAVARDALLAALAFFTNTFAVYAFFGWVPLVLTSAGFSLDQAVRGALIFNLAGIGGSVLNAWAISRIGSRAPLLAVAAVAILGLAGLAWAAQGNAQAAAWFVAIAAAGFGIHALQSGMYIVSAHIFPTECRTSGVGFASGAGRLGGIVSSFVGGLLLAQGGPAGFFAGVALVLALTALCVLALRGHARRRPFHKTAARTCR